jgi:hypothetical protein
VSTERAARRWLRYLMNPRAAYQQPISGHMYACEYKRPIHLLSTWEEGNLKTSNLAVQTARTKERGKIGAFWRQIPYSLHCPLGIARTDMNCQYSLGVKVTDVLRFYMQNIPHSDKNHGSAVGIEIG